MKDIWHDISELPKMPELETNFLKMPKSWGFGCGIKDLHPQQWAVYFVDPDLNRHLYALPLCVSTLLEWQCNNAREDVQKAIKTALGIE